jgi:hypothetical protein
MNLFDNAKRFFEACESAQGWQGCKQYVQDGAIFNAQSEPLVELNDVKGYCEWVADFGNIISPQGSYTLHTSSFDNSTNTAIFFATFHAKHTGEGGPVPPTGKSVDTHYVYILAMSEEGKVSHMTKVWNAPWAMKALGWC